VDNAWNKGVFLACAAGNSNTSSTSSAYPGAYSNTNSV
jgi:thermitase